MIKKCKIHYLRVVKLNRHMKTGSKEVAKVLSSDHRGRYNASSNLISYTPALFYCNF